MCSLEIEILNFCSGQWTVQFSGTSHLFDIISYLIKLITELGVLVFSKFCILIIEITVYYLVGYADHRCYVAYIHAENYLYLS